MQLDKSWNKFENSNPQNEPALRLQLPKKFLRTKFAVAKFNYIWLRGQRNQDFTKISEEIMMFNHKINSSLYLWHVHWNITCKFWDYLVTLRVRSYSKGRLKAIKQQWSRVKAWFSSPYFEKHLFSNFWKYCHASGDWLVLLLI